MPAKLIRSFHNVTNTDQGGVVTIGNFDGVHLGHQALLKRVIEEAKQRGVPSVVMTFEPHPLEFFKKDQASIARLTRFREKFLALQAVGIDRVLVVPFNQALANQSASDFVQHLLANTLRPQHVIVGDDFHFGRQRQGDFKMLADLGREHGYTAEAMPTYQLEGSRVSSTRIRTILQSGDLDLAKTLLGRPYSMQGRVRYGDQLGRQWGFPTANIFLQRELAPVMGIYTVLVHGLGDKPLPGAANLGVRPTVDGTRALLEVHLLDFNKQIYGHCVEVEFCKKLRDEERFANIELLKTQIADDVNKTRDYFQKQGIL